MEDGDSRFRSPGVGCGDFPVLLVRCRDLPIEPELPRSPAAPRP